MKLPIHNRLQPLGRRDLLKHLGAAALALPALELFERQARAQALVKKSKYVVFCYTPDGVNQKAFWPTGIPTNYALSPILAPFEPYKDKLLILGPLMTISIANAMGVDVPTFGEPTLADKSPLAGLTG
jgi:Protein of unknown function (DUF1552)